MAAQLFILPIVLSSLASFAFSHPTSSSPIPPFIVSTCTKTNYPDICFTSIQPYAQSLPNIDNASMFGLLVRATMAYTKTTRKLAAQINAENIKEYCSVEEEKVIRNCEKSYKDALDSLDSAVMAVRRDDKAIANYMLKSAVRDFGSCRQGFLDVPRIVKMVVHDELLVKMATNCLDMLKLL